ncbi:hypothetical protein L7F22_021654 [Adiantum nelumboides]|nr:hypothetical protein [Adiantum nelumboides]
MPDLVEDAVRIAIFVSKGRSGLKVLKWVLENEDLANGLLYLIYVQSPLRWVPNALGGKFPVEQVRPEMIKKYKIHRLLETQKLLDQYKRICDKKKIETKVCYSESDSVQKELVSQILRNGITKLIWGDLSQRLFSRALKRDSISAFVAKNAPDFCTVMVVNKGRLHFVKHATQAIAMQYSSPLSENVSRMSRVSETTFESEDVFEDGSRASIDLQDGERSTWPGILDDISSSQSKLLDFSQTSSQWVLCGDKCNNAVNHSPAVGVIIRELPDNNNPSSSRCEPQTTLSTEARSLEASISGELVPEAGPPIHKDCLMASSLVASDCVVSSEEHSSRLLVNAVYICSILQSLFVVVLLNSHDWLLHEACGLRARMGGFCQDQF